MELIAYLCLITLSIIASTAKYQSISERTASAVAVISFAILSATVRIKGFDDDINVYAQRMTEWDFSAYYLREFAFWVPIKLLHAVIQNPTAVLIITDVLTYALILAALRNFRLPAYACLAVICIFPFVMGMQNVYRQWIAAAMLLYAVSAAGKNPALAGLAVVSAVFTHNAAALFVGAIIPLLPIPGRLKVLGLLVSAFSVPLIMHIGSGTRGLATSGADLRLVYLGLVGAGAVAIAWLLDLGGKEGKERAAYLAYLPFVVALSIPLLAHAGSERAGMYAVFLLYPFGILAIERLGKLAPFVRVLIPILGFAPVLMFSTKIFIIGDPVPDIERTMRAQPT